MSIHTDKAFEVAQRKGAYAACSYTNWCGLMALSKRELAEVAVRLGAVAAGECDSAEVGYQRAMNERDALKANGII